MGPAPAARVPVLVIFTSFQDMAVTAAS